MARRALGADDAGPAKVVVTLHGEAPVQAAQLGRLLVTLAADYRRMNPGRTLVVAYIRTGSVITELTDLVKNVADGAKAAKAIADFAHTVADLLKLTRNDQATLASGKQLRGQRSVEALLEVAINSGHEVELRHTTGDGAVIDLKVTPVEATKIRERNRLRIAQMEAAYRTALPPPAPRHLLATPEQMIENVSGHVLVHERDALRALIHSDWIGDAGNPEVETLVVKLATTLRDAGLNHVLVSLAAELEASGHQALGQRLRREATG